MLSQHSQIPVFFSPEVANVDGEFSFVVDDNLSQSLTSVVARLAQTYQVKVEVVEDSILVAKQPDAKLHTQQPKTIPKQLQKKASGQRTEELIVSAPAIQTRINRGFQSYDNAESNYGVRVESLEVANATSYPVNNLAESLLTVPGVAASFDGGEGRQIALRGLGGDFVYIALNGMQTLAVHGSSLDSREQNERALAFDFNVLPTELFEQINISRDYAVTQDSGGIAANINVFSSVSDELRVDGWQFNAFVENNYHQLADKVGSSVAFNWQANYGDWFYALSASYKQKHTQEQGFNTYRWRNINIADTDISQLATDTQELLQQQQVYFPRGNRYSVWYNQIKQAGFTAALHYLSPKLQHKLDVVVSQLSNQKSEDHLATRGIGSSALAKVDQTNSQVSKLLDLQLDEFNFANYARVEHAQLASESRQLKKDSQFSQLTWAGESHLNQQWTLHWLAGTARNILKIPHDHKVYLKTYADFVSDYRYNTDYPRNTYFADLTQAPQWQLDEVDVQSSRYKLTQKQFKLAVDYQQQQQKWTFAAQTKSFADRRLVYQQGDLFKSEFAQGVIDNQVTDPYYRLANKHKELEWAGVNLQQIKADLLPDHAFSDSELNQVQSYSLERKQYAAWVGYQHQQDDLTVNLAARHEQLVTDIRDASNVRATTPAQHKLMLLSANLLYQLDEGWQLRLVASQNYTPVQTKYYVPTPSLISGIDGYLVGNSQLAPYKSNQIALQSNLTVDDSYLSVALYNKRLDNLINYQQIGFYADKPLYQSVNAEHAWLTGLDVSWQQQWSPQFSSQLSYSFADAARTHKFADIAEYCAQLEGLSKHIVSMTLDYQYKNWGARLAANYRSGYVDQIKFERAKLDQIESGYLAYARMNASAFYKVSRELEVNFGVQNLANQYYREYAGKHQHLYNTTETGRQFYLRWVLML
ncbi:TonB-dependent receptor domain-containing protein [Catenovulum agarivorans]|nr:TonB-dependent receptor [Catenovulum agarivorans]